MESKKETFIRGKEGEPKESAAEEMAQQVKKSLEKTEQAASPLDQIQQQAVMAYAAYMEAEQQVARAYKENEGHVQKAYGAAEQQAQKAYDESMAQALRRREEAELQAKKAFEESLSQASQKRAESTTRAAQIRRETMDQAWAIYTKSRKIG